MAKRGHDAADQAWLQIEARAEEMISEGHPAAQEHGWDKGKLITWFMANTDEGRRLRDQYSEAMHRRHGGGPISPVDLPASDSREADDVEYLQLTDRGGGELGSSRRFGEPSEGGSKAYSELFSMAAAIHELEPEKDFNSVFLATCMAEQAEARAEGRESLIERHYAERAEAIRRGV